MQANGRLTVSRNSLTFFCETEWLCTPGHGCINGVQVSRVKRVPAPAGRQMRLFAAGVSWIDSHDRMQVEWQLVPCVHPQAICPPGTYNDGTFGTCTVCEAGKYGATSGLLTSGCTGYCSAGSYCPRASTNASAVPCPRGFYCPTGAATPTPCAGGVYGGVLNLKTPQCSGSCPAGYYCQGKG
jgi:hypothetical protein